MKKAKIWALSIAAALLASVVAPVFSAKAAVKEQPVGDRIITESGILNELDWTIMKTSEGDVYVPDVRGDVLYVKNGTGYLTPWNKGNFADGDVTMEFDFYGVKSINLSPFVGTFVDSPLGTAYYGTNGLIDVLTNTKYRGEDGKMHFYDDYELTKNDQPCNQGVWFTSYPDNPNGTRLQWIFRADGALGFKRYALGENGQPVKPEPDAQIWLKNAFGNEQYPLSAETDYYFGLRLQDAKEFTIDNLKIYNAAGTIASCDFSGSWDETDGIPTSGKVYRSVKGGTKSISEILLDNPSNDDRIVSELKVSVDKNAKRGFILSGGLDFRALTKRFGFAFGLENQNSAIGEGNSFVYFYNGTENDQTVTFANVSNDGEEGTPVSFGKDLTAEEMLDFTLVTALDGKATLTVGGIEKELQIAHQEGYCAIVTAGEGSAVVALEGSLTLSKYVYRGSAGKALGNNFNTGYINGENYVYGSVGATQFKNPEKAEGMLFEDGKLKFKGTGDTTFFGFAENYSDYILEFVYESFHNDDKPEFKEEWQYGYSPFTVDLGITGNGGGWGSSVMIQIYDNHVKLMNLRQGLEVYDVKDTDYGFQPAQAGTTKRTAIKFVVASNVISVYMQDVTLKDFAAADYVKYAEFTVPDVYGRVAIATTEGGYFNIDDLRITPVDDPDDATMAENIANYVDFASIENEYEPKKLASPVLSVNGAVVSWQAVDGATGYKVIVNGTEYEVGAEVLSYEVADNATVKVIAVGDGKRYLTSDESAEVKVTIRQDSSIESGESGDKPGDSSGSEGKSENSGGCFGSVGGSGIAILFGAAALAILKRKKSEE